MESNTAVCIFLVFDYQTKINPITAFNSVQFTERLGFVSWDNYMTDFTFTVRKDCITLITADIYMPGKDIKGSVKTTNIGSRLVGQWQFKTEQAHSTCMLKFNPADRLLGLKNVTM